MGHDIIIYILNGLQGNELNMFEQKNHQLKWPQSQALIVMFFQVFEASAINNFQSPSLPVDFA